MENQAKSPRQFPIAKRPFWLSRLLSFEKDAVFLPPFSFGGWIYFLAGLTGAMFTGWVVFPMLLYSEQPQPMEFNHALHMNPEIVDGIEGDSETEKCLYCHNFREDGTFAGIPRLASCMECHDDPEFPFGETEAEKAFLVNYVAKGKEVPWRVYYRQPDNVYFSHIAHVKMGEIDCEVCHGNHGLTEKLPVYKENRLTGYSINIWGRNIAGWKLNSWDRMKMDDCAECHKESGEEQNNACAVCHK